MTSNQHGPYVRGYTRVTMARDRGMQACERRLSPKTRRSSDRGLQPAPVKLDSLVIVKLDSLVIAHQPWRGEYVPGPCTHRPSSHGSRESMKAVTARVGQVRDR